MLKRTAFLSGTCILLLLAAAARAEPSARTMAELGTGLPAAAGTTLSAQYEYVPATARKLAKAKVRWVNVEALRDRGVDVPLGPLAPEFQKELLDVWGYAVPSITDTPDLFGPETKVVYSERYGGDQISNNWGAGRASTNGVTQVKGDGPKPTVGAFTDPHHANGRSSQNDPLVEAVWGEVNHRELSNGSNQALFMIDPGHGGGMVGRDDELRPAHFMFANGAETDEAPYRFKATELDRLKDNIEKLPDLLPLPKDAKFTDRAEKLRAGFLGYVDHLAQTYAEEYARKYYHGGTSASNIKLNGGSIDHGSMSAQRGYHQIHQYSNPAFGMGEVKEVFDMNVRDFIRSLKKYAPAELSHLLPNESQALRALYTRYGVHLRRELLALTGAPDHLVDRLAGKPAGERLGRTLRNMSRREAKKILIAQDAELAESKPVFDFEKILPRLAEASSNDPARLEAAIAPFVPNAADRARLAKDYAAFAREVEALATEDGVSADHLRKGMALAAARKNSVQPQLFFKELATRAWEKVDQARAADDYRITQRFVDDTVTRSLRTFRDAAPYDVVLGLSRDPLNGTETRQIFDEKTGAYKVVHRMSVGRGKVSYRGAIVDAADVAEGKPKDLAVLAGTEEFAPRVARNGRFLEAEFHVPSLEQAQLLTKRVATGQGMALAPPSRWKKCPAGFSQLVLPQ